MVLILAMISIMTLKWGLGRYLITTRVSKSINCKALADACLAQKIALWGGTAPSNGTYWCGIETANDVEVTVSGSQITFEVDDADCTYN